MVVSGSFLVPRQIHSGVCRARGAAEQRGHGGAGSCSGAEVAGVVLGCKGGGVVAR
jgi:hypothetical protein